MRDIKMKSVEALELKLLILEKENLEIKKNLHEAYEEMEKIFINNNPDKIKNNFKVIRIDQRYGAAEIIRKSLQYRLGATIIHDTRSINSIPKVPFNLLKNYIDFKKDDANTKEKHNLHDYYDYPKAMELQEHLSYKVGLCIVNSIENPLQAPLLPFRIFSEIYKFKCK